MAVNASRCIARADCIALDLLAAGGRRFGSPRLTAARHRRRGLAVWNRSAYRPAVVQRLAPWASTFRSWGPVLTGGNLHARTPSRQIEWRGSRVEADAVERSESRGDGLAAAPPRRRWRN